MKINKIKYRRDGSVRNTVRRFLYSKLGKERVEFVMDQARQKYQKEERLLQRQTL